MAQLTPSDLMTLEAYSKYLKANKAKLIAHRRARTVHLGEHITLQFEDRETIQYQVQEMLRTERIFEAEGIADELGAYNPLIPDGSNWKVTLLIEFVDPLERARRLAELRGIEDRCWVQAAGHARVFAIADEDLERENDVKTSAVHFLRFELEGPMVTALKAGAALGIGVDHPEYRAGIPALGEVTRKALVEDLA